MFDILSLYNDCAAKQLGLAVLPIERLLLYEPAEIDGVWFSPADKICGLDIFLDEVDDRAFYPIEGTCGDQVVVNLTGDSLRRINSKSSKVSKEIFDDGTLVVCPVSADWELFKIFSHADDVSLLISLSERASSALDIPRFLYCSLDIPEQLPGIPGQWKDSHGIFGGAILGPTEKGRLIGGRKTSTISVAGGLGLELTPLEILALRKHDCAKLQQRGEVGEISRHALKLLSKAMYSSSDTLKYISIIALMEYLGTGPQYTKFEEVKKKLLPHLARNLDEYRRLAARFQIFTSHNQDGRHVGYRHRIIHEGDLLEEILPEDKQRKDLFKELQRYVEKILSDMCGQPEMKFEELQNWRASRTQEINRNA